VIFFFEKGKGKEKNPTWYLQRQVKKKKGERGNENE
jgi:hypothetical protein